MIWYTYSLGGRYTIIVAESLQDDGQVYQYRFAVATHEIPYTHLDQIFYRMQRELNRGVFHGIA